MTDRQRIQPSWSLSQILISHYTKNYNYWSIQKSIYCKGIPACEIDALTEKKITEIPLNGNSSSTSYILPLSGTSKNSKRFHYHLMQFDAFKSGRCIPLDVSWSHPARSVPRDQLTNIPTKWRMQMRKLCKWTKPSNRRRRYIVWLEEHTNSSNHRTRVPQNDTVADGLKGVLIKSR